MIGRIIEWSLAQRAFVLSLVAVLVFGGLYAFTQLDIVAYPDPSPPMVDIITQYPGYSAEEVERLITTPLEKAINGVPNLGVLRSLSLFGLSDIKVYFEFGSDLFHDRQEVLNRIDLVSLPESAQPTLSPWSAIGEIYRYELNGPGKRLTELKAIQDWMLVREFRSLQGVIDVVGYGGAIKQYRVNIDPGALIAYDLSLRDVLEALRNSNANVGGSYLALGAQSYNVRGVGLIKDLGDIADVVVAEREGTPVFVRNLGSVEIGHAVRLGRVGVDDRDDTVEGVVLMHRDAKAKPTLERVKQKVGELNRGKLPAGVTITPVYDRSVLIETVVKTVLDVLLGGIVLVFAILLLFLGHLRAALMVASTVPLTLLVTFSLMVALDQSANLISLGAIDFGIIVDAPLIMVESIFFYLAHQRVQGVSTKALIIRAGSQVGRSIFFSTTIIVVAFIPLFTMTGVPGKIFAPMSRTYGFSLAGALLIALTVMPVFASYWFTGTIRETDTFVVRGLRRLYLPTLAWAIAHRKTVLGISVGLLMCALLGFHVMGKEFMPTLEEGNLWVRAKMPVEITFDEASRLSNGIRDVFRQRPEVKTVVSQLGRPDDGTDPTLFFTTDFFVNLKPPAEWPRGMNKARLIEDLDRRLSTLFPGIVFKFSQAIQDNVEEAMSGVKAQNSIKLFGPDFGRLEAKAEEIKRILETIPGIEDLGVWRILGQPNLVIQVDRAACARYGVLVSDVNAMVEAAIGGKAVTQVLEGDRRFDLVVRFLPKYRKDIEAVESIRVATASGIQIPLKQLATITKESGAVMIYREQNERYIPITFSVRGRDLASTVEEARSRLFKELRLPKQYRIEWAGQYDQLLQEQQRLAIIIPITLLVIYFLLYTTFNSFRDAMLVLVCIPFALIGGGFALFLTGTPFSISAAVGVVSTLGVVVLSGVLLISRITDFRQQGVTLYKAIFRGAEIQMRPILMATLGAAAGLLPAATATAIGAQTQQPLARVVVGGMVTAAVFVLVVLPVLYYLAHRKEDEEGEAEQ